MTGPRWWRRVWLRRDLRQLAAYRRRIRATAARAELAYRQGADGGGRDLAACAVLLVDCDDAIDRVLDELAALTD